MNAKRPPLPASGGFGSSDEFVRRLFDDHGAALYRFALGRMVDRRDAEEVVAETLTKAWRHHHQFDEERGSERAWLLGIARNVSADLHRRKGRHLRAVGPGDVPEQRDPDDRIDLVADASVVRDALMGLSKDHREVIVEAFFAGRTSVEIARRLGIPLGTVKSRMYYGMRALRAGLEEGDVLR